MEASFDISPNKDAVEFLKNKKPFAADIFHELLPELKARAFTIAGIEGANLLQAARDAVAAIPQGSMTWDQAKAEISDQLEPYLGEDGSQARAEVVLRVNGYQSFSTSLYQTAQGDDDTTHLQYLHGECKVPTPSHLALNGIVLPKNNPFWQSHTGPWGHLGCVCYFRPMNDDLVADEKEADASRNPDARNVITGPSLKALQHGDIIRNGVHYNIAPNGPDNSGFKWNPGDLRIPLKDLEAKYDPEVWSEFKKNAQTTLIGDTTLWDWLSGSELTESKPLQFETWQQAQSWADDHLHPTRLALTPHEQEALTDYQQNSGNLNDSLIAGDKLTPGERLQVERLDSTMRDKLPQPMTLWHGGGGKFWSILQPGNITTLKAYLSTSFSEERGRGFAVTAIVKIHAPAGQRGIYMDKLDGSQTHYEEVEWTLPRNSKLKIISVEQQGSKYYIEAQLL